jgi:hypothetical protein
MPGKSFCDIVNAAHLDRVLLSAMGHGVIEDIHFDFATMKGEWMPTLLRLVASGQGEAGQTVCLWG